LVEGLEEIGFRLMKRGEREEGNKPEKLSRFFLGKTKTFINFGVPKVYRAKQFFEIMKYNNQARLTISSKKLVSILE
jgi:hypothetical protein